ncbi:PaaI family thioesterase [Peptococcaceae bacterium 1198_IL3148]
MEDKIKEFFKGDRFADYVGIKLVKVEPGYAVTEMDIAEHHLNGVNIIQGGAIFTLADFAFAAASNAGGQVTVGMTGNISYFKAAQGQKLVAEAKEIFASHKTASYSVDVFDDNKTLIARLTVTGYKKGQRIDFDNI